MAGTDNTTTNAGSGGDTIRDIQRTAGGPKTQVVQLDFGGANTNAETLVDATHGLPVTVLNNALPAAPVIGQQTVTMAAAPLPSSALMNGIQIEALSSNTGQIYIGIAGVSAATGYLLMPGATLSLAVANLSALFIIGTNTTDRVAFAGS